MNLRERQHEPREMKAVLLSALPRSAKRLLWLSIRTRRRLPPPVLSLSSPDPVTFSGAHHPHSPTAKQFSHYMNQG